MKFPSNRFLVAMWASSPAEAAKSQDCTLEARIGTNTYMAARKWSRGVARYMLFKTEPRDVG